MALYYQDILQDLRYAWRSLRRQPGLTATATLSAALGIGVCTVVFGIANLALFQHLPVQAPERLMAIESRTPRGENPFVSRSELRALRAADSWESIAFCIPYLPGALGPSGSVEPAWGSIVSGNYFDVAKPGFALGQGFIDGEDDVEGAAPKVVLSHAIWRERYRADETLLGKEIRINGRPIILTGVTAPSFKGTNAGLVVDYYLPLSQAKELETVLDDPDFEVQDDLPMWLGLGRLRSGVDAAQAKTELDVVQAGLAERTPERDPERGFSIVPAGQTSRFLVAAVRPLFLLLAVVAGLVLLTACANVANLLLARASIRGPEIATRLALGAGRPRIVRQLLTESILLASFGGILGVAFAAWAGGLGGRLTLPIDVPIDLALPADYRTVLVAALLCFAAGILFGLVPALRSTKTGVFDALRSNASASTAGLRRVSVRNVLATVQIAISAALLVCSLIFLRSFGAVSDSLIGGVNPDGISVVGFNPAMSGYDATTGQSLLERILRKAETTPGVLSASLTDAIPSLGQEADLAIEPIARGEAGERVNIVSITPGFLNTVGLRLVSGEALSRNSLNEDLLLVDERLARTLFPSGAAVGSTVFDRNGDALRIAGVVENVSADSATGAAKPVLLAYRSLLASYAQNRRAAFTGLSLVLKTSQTAAPVALISQEILVGEDPNLVVSAPRTLQEIIDESLVLIELPAILFGVCGLMGLVIGSVGIYGVMSFAVVRRFREIGIRRALGQQASQVVRDVIVHGATVAGIGIAIGLGVGFGLARLAESFILGVNVSDAATYAQVAAIILAVALAASAVPAARAARVNPSSALRSE